MQTLDQCLTEMLGKGVISKEEARYKAQNKDRSKPWHGYSTANKPSS